MRVYRRLEDLPRDRRRAVTVGVFDGVHRGHRRILAALLGAARRRRLDASCAITFWPHPMAVLRPERAPGLLLTLEERIAALADTGLDELLILPFDREVAATDYADFARDALVGAAGMVQLVAGYDFHLGRGRAGSAEAMAALGESLGYRVDVVEFVDSAHTPRNTLIRAVRTGGRSPAAREEFETMVGEWGVRPRLADLLGGHR